jgi:hypothetical protein
MPGPQKGHGGRPATASATSRRWSIVDPRERALTRDKALELLETVEELYGQPDRLRTGLRALLEEI